MPIPGGLLDTLKNESTGNAQAARATARAGFGVDRKLRAGDAVPLAQTLTGVGADARLTSSPVAMWSPAVDTRELVAK